MSHPVPHLTYDDEQPSSMRPKHKALKRKMKVQSSEHGTRRLHHRSGKMVESPLIKLKRLL